MRRAPMKNLVMLLVLTLLGMSCSKQVYVADIDTSNYRIGKWHKSDSDLDAMIAPYKSQLDDQMNAVIAYNPAKMPKQRPSSALGNWFADILEEEASKIYGVEVDFAVQNYGGLRVPALNKGDVTVGSIYELMPFDNTLVVLELDGKTTKKLLDRIAAKGGWPVSRGLSFKIKKDKAKDIMIGGNPFDSRKNYTVALPDYIANGGDQCFFLKDGPRKDNKAMLRDIVIDHLKAKKGDAMTITQDANRRIN